MGTLLDGSNEVQVVEHQATWRGGGRRVSFVLPSEELNGAGLLRYLRAAVAEGLDNPRVITPSVIAWSWLLHPRFHHALARRVGAGTRNVCALSEAARACLHLESSVFLAGVTLSAAIVQGRWSSGTVGSKLDRLWQAGSLACQGVGSGAQQLDLHVVVLRLAQMLTVADTVGCIDLLLQIRRIYMELLRILARGKTCTSSLMRVCVPLAPKFAFAQDLVRELPSIVCIIAYGSSVSSDSYNDYDLVLVARDPEAVLLRLANTNPQHHGIEINLSV